MISPAPARIPEDYRYSSAIDYVGEKGLLNNVVVFGFLNCRTTRRDSRGSMELNWVFPGFWI